MKYQLIAHPYEQLGNLHTKMIQTFKLSLDRKILFYTLKLGFT